MTFRQPSAALVAGLFALLASGCASPSADYPSLAIRDGERITASVPSATPDTGPSAPPSTAVLAQVESYQNSASRADTAFQARAAAVLRQVQAARGAAVASDRWASAQVAISGLDSLRSTTALALADLDLLHADRALALQPRSSIDAARDTVAALLARQDATLNRLKAMLRQ